MYDVMSVLNEMGVKCVDVWHTSLEMWISAHFHFTKTRINRYEDNENKERFKNSIMYIYWQKYINMPFLQKY